MRRTPIIVALTLVLLMSAGVSYAAYKTVATTTARPIGATWGLVIKRFNEVTQKQALVITTSQEIAALASTSAPFYAGLTNSGSATMPSGTQGVGYLNITAEGGGSVTAQYCTTGWQADNTCTSTPVTIGQSGQNMQIPDEAMPRATGANNKIKLVSTGTITRVELNTRLDLTSPV